MHPFTFANGKRAQMNPMTAHRILAHHGSSLTEMPLRSPK
jgi:hypothetical protein